VKQVRLVKWLRLSVALCALSSVGLVVSSAGAASSPVLYTNRRTRVAPFTF